MSFTTHFGEFRNSWVMLDMIGLRRRGLGFGVLSGRRMRRTVGVDVPVRKVDTAGVGVPVRKV